MHREQQQKKKYNNLHSIQIYIVLIHKIPLLKSLTQFSITHRTILPLKTVKVSETHNFMNNWFFYKMIKVKGENGYNERLTIVN